MGIATEGRGRMAIWADGMSRGRICVGEVFGSGMTFGSKDS